MSIVKVIERVSDAGEAFNITLIEGDEFEVTKRRAFEVYAKLVAEAASRYDLRGYHGNDSPYSAGFSDGKKWREFREDEYGFEGFKNDFSRGYICWTYRDGSTTHRIMVYGPDCRDCVVDLQLNWRKE